MQKDHIQSLDPEKLDDINGGISIPADLLSNEGIAAFCTAWAMGMPPRDALAFANHTAAITVCRMGAQPSLPTLREVLALLREQGAGQLLSHIPDQTIKE